MRPARVLIGRVLSYAALGIAVLLVLFPIYWMVITSLKLPREIFRMPSLWPQIFTLNNYHMLLDDKGFLAHHPQQPDRRLDRDHDLGAHLVVRRLLDGALPLPLPRR